MAFIVDNGAYTIKASLGTSQECKLIPNSVIKAKHVRNRVFIGDQIEECKDLSGLFYLLPFQKGYVTNWEVEKQVWDHMLAKDDLKMTPSETSVIVTEPIFNFTSVKEALTELLFEEYDFQAIYKCPAPYLAYLKYLEEKKQPPLCCLVVDSGYSFTHIVPICNGKIAYDSVKRINVGGKLLTNHLKEIISYRQVMVMDETYVVNQMKEDVCYVSTQFLEDMKVAKKRCKENTVTRDYVLPDYTHIKRGYARSGDETVGKPKGSEQIIVMNNERFAVPEILFHPSDISIAEKGIPEAILESVALFPEEMHLHFYQNVILIGGNCMFPGFKDRLYQDLRPLILDEYPLYLHLPQNPVTYAWQGGVAMSRSPRLKNLLVTRREYDDEGHKICTEKFGEP